MVLQWFSEGGTNGFPSQAITVQPHHGVAWQLHDGVVELIIPATNRPGSAVVSMSLPDIRRPRFNPQSGHFSLYMASEL